MWEKISNAWGVVSDTVSSAYEGSFVQDVYQAGQKVAGFLQTQADTPLGKFATAAYGDFSSNRKQLTQQRVGAKRVSSSKYQGAGKGSTYSAGKANLGITPTVQTAYQSALKARADSPIEATLRQLAAKNKSVSVMSVTDIPAIKVRRRAQ
jgi:hypothetical protein